MALVPLPRSVEQQAGYRFWALEITGKCQLRCTHCYAGSSPQGTHGTMTLEEWLEVIDQAAKLGVGLIQFIGGEPTQHPGLSQMVQRALSHDLPVEVYSNLVGVSPALWELFQTPGVSLATSYYSDDPAQHQAVTSTARSHHLTTRNIAEAVRRQIPIRVGIIGVEDDQHIEGARNLLRAMGVTDIGYDKLRKVGRGAESDCQDLSQLCGQCANATLTITPDGKIQPCVFTRQMVLGNIREMPLGDILGSMQATEVLALLEREFASRPTPDRGCTPSSCIPTTPPYMSGKCTG